MPNNEWTGAALKTAQVYTMTFGGTWEVDDLVKPKLRDEANNPTELVITSGSTVIATICTTVRDYINAIFDAGNTASPFYAVAAAATSTTVTLTAREAGVPFYPSVATADAGGAADAQTLTGAITTANSGPNDWNTAANWTLGAVPVDSDNVFITAKSNVPILYGLYQTPGLTLLNSIELAALYIEQGHPQIATLAAALCVQYAKLDIGATAADGKKRTSNAICNLNAGDYQVTGIIRSTAPAGQGGRAPVQILANHASTTFTVTGDSIVGFATSTAGETGQIATITVQDRARVTSGAGLTLATLNPEGGTSYVAGTVTTIGYGLGAVNVTGAGNITTANVGGKFVWESTGTITTLYVSGQGEARPRSGTVSNAHIYGETARIICDSGIPLSVTWSNGVDCEDGATSAQVDFGGGLTVTPSAL